MRLDDRMKSYEQDSVGKYLLRRCPAIIRVDGRAFHTFTRGFDRPWADRLQYCMMHAAMRLCEEISSAKLAYGQSDEISILLTDYDNLETEQWFNGGVQKIVSVSASLATLAFNEALFLPPTILSDAPLPDMALGRKGYMMSKVFQASFDSRVFSIPKEDVVNYFIWRQQDAVRNSVQMLGRAHFSHKQLMNKNSEEIQEMLWQEHKINWNDTPVTNKRGWAIRKVPKDVHPKWAVDLEMPTITADRNYIAQWLEPQETV